MQDQIDVSKIRERSDSHLMLFQAIKNIRSMCYLFLKQNPQIKGKFTEQKTHHIPAYKDHIIRYMNSVFFLFA